MRKIALFLVLILLLGQAASAFSEVYLDREPPEDWASRDDILRLTGFQTLINDCSLLEVGGRSMLIDGGVRKWRQKLVPALAELGYDGRVDILFNTHPHDDHLEGVYYMVREGFRADEFWSGFPATHKNPLQQKMVRELEKAGIPYHQLSQFETVDFGGATLVFFWWEGGQDPNARSVVMHITFGNSTVLMAADIGGQAESFLLKDVPAELLKADILKYPHHGILPARSDFMKAVDPAFTYVSSRKSAIKGTVEQLKNRGIPCYHTTSGRVVMVTDGTDWYIKQYKDTF